VVGYARRNARTERGIFRARPAAQLADGIGGADPQGHGLLGIEDRGRTRRGLRIDSPRGGGTVLAAELPLS
jgi:hypothetical protein